MTGAGDEIERFRVAIARHLGLQFDDGKRDFLGQLLDRRARASAQTTSDYVDSVASGPPPHELDALAEELTVGETYFFRYAEQYASFAEVALPSCIARRRAQRTLRILSAGCSSGEEPYSLAIAVLETLSEPAWDVTIRAVDINPTALRRAASARYTAWALRETSAERRKTWFREHGRDLVLVDSVRRAVRFEQRNLATADAELWAPESYDVIFCRNVLMYLAPEVLRQVVARIEAALCPGGYLFVGHAESLRGLAARLQLCQSHGTFYYRRAGGRADHDARPHVASPAVAWPVAATDASQGTWMQAIEESAARIRTLAEPPAPVAATIAHPGLGRVLELLQHEQFADALACFDAMKVDVEHDRDALLLRAVLLAHGGRFADAEAACRRLLATDARHAGAHYLLALCSEGLGDPARAADHDQRAIELDPMFAMPHLHLGTLARRAGDREIARHELAEAVRLLGDEDPRRLVLFGGGFRREALIAMCRGQLETLGAGR